MKLKNEPVVVCDGSGGYAQLKMFWLVNCLLFLGQSFISCFRDITKSTCEGIGFSIKWNKTIDNYEFKLGECRAQSA